MALNLNGLNVKKEKEIENLYPIPSGGNDSLLLLLSQIQNKAVEFLQITSRTIESYFDSCAGGEEAKENSEEFQFVLALVGIITNMAAAAQGREFLVTKDSGRVLIDTFMKVLGGSSAGKNVKMRNLILMALYNVR